MATPRTRTAAKKDIPHFNDNVAKISCVGAATQVGRAKRVWFFTLLGSTPVSLGRNACMCLRTLCLFPPLLSSILYGRLPSASLQAKLKDLHKAAEEAGVQQGLELPLSAANTGGGLGWRHGPDLLLQAPCLPPRQIGLHACS